MDSALNFKEHFTKCMAKAHQMEKNTKRLHGKYGLTPEKVRKITTAVI
jgi:hypothetical protein